MKKSVSSKRSINSSDYVNVHTGETLGSEYGNSIRSVNISDDSVVILRSSEFVITDTRTIDYLKSILSKSDLSYVHLMIQMVYGGFNILYDRSYRVPHTSKSLQVDLELANTAFYGLLQRLYKKGVIYYISGYVGKKQVKHIMLNPTIGRRTNQIKRECLSYFEDLSSKKSLK